MNWFFEKVKDPLINDAFREAESEILPFISHFSENFGNSESLKLNYSIAALAAVKATQKLK